jgi:arylsulfatase A-like enzyme
MLNYFDAHEPYAPPTPFLQRFASADIHPNPKVDLEDPKAPWTEADAKEFVAAYDGGIAYLDAELGDIFAALERQGQLRNTVVIVTSDHGEEFGEHGWFGHGDSLYLPALHVPLIIVGPQGVPAGAVVSEPVSLRDIPATVLDLVDRTARVFPGQSLARYWNASPAALSEDVIVAGVRRTIGQPASHPLSSGGAVALIDRRYHYVRYFGSGREQLFSFREDPWERSDLAGDPAAQAQIEVFRRALQRVPGLDSLR